ncbi:MAG: hypothetical protein ACREOI_32355 [bacterium]
MTNGTIHDHTLPQLQQATDPNIMTAAFEAFFSGQYPNRGLKVNDCQISRFQHKPGKECNITYRLAGHDCDRGRTSSGFSPKCCQTVTIIHRRQTASRCNGRAAIFGSLSALGRK